MKVFHEVMQHAWDHSSIFVHLCKNRFLPCVEGMRQRDSEVRDVYLPAAQRDGFNQDLCSVSFVEQHDAGGQLTCCRDTHTDMHY